MSSEPIIAVLSGGVSSEREVSLASGKEMEAALKQNFSVEHFVLDANALPESLDPSKHVVFPAMHGMFGEDGKLQTLLEQGGFAYAGSDASSSALCMDKVATKASVLSNLVRVPRDIHGYPEIIGAQEVIRSVGDAIIVKPSNQGSSVGLHFVDGLVELTALLAELTEGSWLFEERIFGREFSVGILGGRALGVVEIIPLNGSYDYEHKYTPGTTEYRFPADIDSPLESELKVFSEKAFLTCNCRDFARADFMVSESGKPYFLEINTIPGLTPTSLLPKSASCSGYDFPDLARLMIEPAIERFYARSLIES